ncbi:MAG: transcription-repair coupling factor [Planctomycetota bacterium]
MTDASTGTSLVDTAAREGRADESTRGTGAILVRASELVFPADELARIRRAIERKGACSVGNVWGGAQALVGAQIAADLDAPMLAIASTDGEAESFSLDRAAFGVAATQFPARESGAKRGAADASAVRARLQLAQALAGPADERPRVIVASVHALLQPIPRLRDLEAEFVRLRAGEVLDVRRLLDRLVKAGYTREPLVEEAGQVSLRGDILDIYPFASEEPLRIEMFEEEIESLRTFDPVEQRSTATHDEIEVCLASDAGGVEDGDGVPLSDLVDPDALVVRVEPLRIDERASGLKIRSPQHERALLGLDSAQAKRRILEIQSLPGEDVSLDTRSVQGLSGGVSATAPELEALAKEGARVIVACLTEAERDRVGAQFEKSGATDLELAVGFVSKGFRAPPWGLLIVGSHELKGTLGARKRAVARAHQHKVKALQSFFELRPGDLVVHAVHGLARYRGLTRMARGTGEEEHLHLIFANDVALYVPASRIDMVQRYIGAGGSGVALDKIGGQSFRKRKEKVEQGLFDLASELIEVQAKRQLRKRDPWYGDDDLVRQFLDEFPYDDTEDQSEASGELARDLASERPMDRLLCGDVGFGKTELAVRAAFRVASAGGQVAVLVPTTVLAEQHLATFGERMADFPLTVRGLSRYTSAAERKDTIEGLAEGRVDVVIGTHRILSKDVTFQRLGLVVIDEEQRFGVTHKEHFKKLRANVDMLTLTATPIPRTLHMSLSGVRDISSLNVPPPGRQEIETVLGYREDDDLIRDAFRRELARGGQIFFLHNRVTSIESVAAHLRGLVPDATYAIGHGQMPAAELREVMTAFRRGEVDVLVATTIIENGVDVPTANTIFVDEADHFGLSELHQLRGRVGRGSVKAYCHLLVEKHKPLKQHARERLKALEEMNHLGAGFGISVKDLELRGAGNILGPQQSGHIAAVGYDMYCRLLKLTVERLAAGEATDRDKPRFEETEAGCELEVGLRAYLPESWIEKADERLDALRALSQCLDEGALEDVFKGLRDRYGRPPAEAKELLRLFELKLPFDEAHVKHVAWHGDRYVMQYSDAVGFEHLFAGRSAGRGRRLDLRRIKPGVAHLVVPEHLENEPAKAVRWLEKLVRPRAS